MNNVVQTFLEKPKWVARTVAKRRWLALGVASIVGIAACVATSKVPNRYEASARVYVDTQTVLKPMMAALTFQPDTDQQVRMLARTLISRPNMERLVSKPELQLTGPGVGTAEEAASRLVDQIKVVPTPSGNLYEISYRGSSAEGARRLVAATVELFVHSGLGAKKRDAEDAGRFIEEQIRTYEAKLVEAEDRRKQFKIRTFGVSGISNMDYFSRVSALTEEVNKLRVDLSAAEQSRDSYRRELAAEEPQLPVELAQRYASGPVSDIEARLDAQRKQLDELRRRYTEEHPDVVSARRVVNQLEVEARERKEADDRLMSRLGKAGRAATSPVYQKLRISLAETEALVASLRSQLGMQQGRLDQVRALAGKVPQVEAELAQLNRDYDVIRKNYDLLVARRESASLGEKVDESAQLAEFRVIDPPRASQSPVFPARLHLALLAVLISLLAGAAAAVAAELVRPTFDELTSLRLLSGRPVLGSVSLLVTPDGQRRQRMSTWGFAAALCALVAMQAIWVAWVALKLPVA